MSKLKRAKKLIGKTIDHDIMGKVYVEDVLYVGDKKDVIYFYLGARPGLNFKVSNEHNKKRIENIKHRLERYERDYLQFQEMKRNGVKAPSYTTIDKLIESAENELKMIERALNHPDAEYAFIKVNSRVRYKIIKEE